MLRMLSWRRFLAQEEERGTPAELQSLHWQAMSQHAAHVTPTPVADMEYCTIGACEYRARSPELVGYATATACIQAETLYSSADLV
jgi:hypothetical protein